MEEKSTRFYMEGNIMISMFEINISKFKMVLEPLQLNKSGIYIQMTHTDQAWNEMALSKKCKTILCVQLQSLLILVNTLTLIFKVLDMK